MPPHHSRMHPDPRPAAPQHALPAARGRLPRRPVGRQQPLEQKRRKARQVARRVEAQARQQAGEAGHEDQPLRALVGGALCFGEQLLEEGVVTFRPGVGWGLKGLGMGWWVVG